MRLYRKRRYRIKKTIPRHVSRFRIKKRRFARRRLSRAVRHRRNNFSRVRRAKPTYIPASFGPVVKFTYRSYDKAEFTWRQSNEFYDSQFKTIDLASVAPLKNLPESVLNNYKRFIVNKVLIGFFWRS